MFEESMGVQSRFPHRQAMSIDFPSEQFLRRFQCDTEFRAVILAKWRVAAMTG